MGDVRAHQRGRLAESWRNKSGALRDAECNYGLTKDDYLSLYNVRNVHFDFHRQSIADDSTCNIQVGRMGNVREHQ